jgi:hypothetical protein
LPPPFFPEFVRESPAVESADFNCDSCDGAMIAVFN